MNRGRPTKLTPEITARIASFVRAGAYPWVAAEANGICHRTFDRWKTAGERARRGRHYDFWRAVRQAGAEARVSAETRVFRDHPETWLTKGPGRTLAGDPGWAETYDLNVQQGPLEVRVVYVNRSGPSERQLRQVVDGGAVTETG